MAAEADDVDIDLNEFESNDLEEDEVLKNSVSNHDLSGDVKAVDPDFDQAQQQARETSALAKEAAARQGEANRRIEEERARKEQESKARAAESEAARLADEQREAISRQQEEEREKAEKDAALEQLRRERVAIDAQQMASMAAPAISAGGGLTPQSLNGSASPSGSDYGF